MRQLKVVPMTMLVVAAALSATVLADPTASLSGTWSGTWQRTSPPPGNGTYKLTVTQVGTDIKGSIEAQRSACLTVHPLNGTINGDKVEFHVADKGITADYTGKVSGNQMSGTAIVKCSTGTGTANWQVTKQ
jgi:hypothetical protein